MKYVKLPNLSFGDFLQYYKILIKHLVKLDTNQRITSKITTLHEKDNKIEQFNVIN